MTDTNLQNKARAVVLSALMVLSVMVGTIALSGGAAAALSTNPTLSSDTVQGGEVVEVTGEAGTNGTVYAFIDEDRNNSYDTGENQASTVIESEDGGEYSINVSAPDESGDYTVEVFQADEDEDYPITVGDDGERNKVLTVDADEPTFGDESPEDGSTVNQANADTIAVPIEDDNTSVANLSATVQNSEDDILTWKIDSSESDDGVNWDDEETGELIIDPGTDSVPALTDGSYDVSVTATDEVGNENTTEFSFSVSSNAPTFTDVNDINETLTNDENETVEIAIDGNGYDIDNSSAELVLDGETYTYEDYQYTNGTETSEFIVDPSNESIDSLSENGRTVTVYAENELGNSNEETYTFTVDTTSPSVTNVELTDELNNSDISENDEQVEVTFADDDDVDADSISANVLIDDKVETVDDFSATTNDNEFSGNLSLALGDYNGVETDSAVVNVTAAQDNASNALANPDDGASNATFAIDTDGPSVELVAEAPNDGDFSGYMNVSQLITSTEDVKDGGLTVDILVGGDEKADQEVESPDHFDTTTLPDGEHVFRVTVTDDSGNSATATEDFELDNGDVVTVQEDFLPGATSAYDVKNNGPFNLSTDVFSVEDGAEVDYEIDGESVEGSNLTFDANDYEDDTTVTLTADADDGNEETVDIDLDVLEFGPIETVGAEDGANPTKVQFEADSELENLTATLVDADDYQHYSDVDKLSDEIEFVEEEDGTYTYETDVPSDLRDGQFEVVVNKVATDSQTLDAEDGVATETITIDNYAPALAGAVVSDGDADGLNVTVQFNESVTGLDVGDAISVEGSDASVTSVAEINASQGVYTLTFDKEFQTADAPNITVGADSVTEEHSAGDSDMNAETKTKIFTQSLGLEKGINTISIPAETGAVAIDDLKLGDHVESIWAYDAADDHWDSHEIGHDKNDLTALEGGEGYVVKTSGPSYIALNAENVPSSESKTPQSEKLSPGWNFIGHYQEGSQSVEQALNPLGDTTYDIYKGYTGDQPDTLQNGEAYWVSVTDDGTENYHMPVEYDGVSSVQPKVADVSVNETDVVHGDDIEITATVDENEPLSMVVVDDISKLGLEDVKLTDEDGDGEYNTTETIAYEDGYLAEGGDDFGVTVTAFDIYGNADDGSTSVSADERNTNVEVSPSSETATANGSDSISYTVTVDDDNDNPISGASVAASGGTNISYATGATQTTDANGEVTFEVSSTTAQDSTLTFTEEVSSDTNSAETTPTFEAGAANSVSITTDTGTTTADGSSTLQYTVSVLDANSNPVQNVDVAASHDGSDITFTGDGSTVNTGSNGDAVFTATSTTAQNVEFTFTEQASGDSNSNTASGTFEAGSATQVSWTQQPTDTTNGSTIEDDGENALSVEVLDSEGNLVEDYSNEITVSISNDASGSDATLSGDVDINATNGVAEFSDLSISNTGDGYTLSAQDTSESLTTGTSDAFNITA